MSSESGYYYVESAEEIRARRCAAAEARCGRLRQRLEALRFQADAAALTYGASVVAACRFPRALSGIGRDADRAERDVDAFEREIEAAASRFDAAIGSARAKAMSAALSTSLDALVRPATSAASTPSAASSKVSTSKAKPAGATDWRSGVAEEVERVMSRVTGDVATKAMSDLNGLVKRIGAETSEDRSRALVLTLREGTQQIREVQAALAVTRKEVERLLCLLDGLDGDAVTHARTRLSGHLTARPLPPGLSVEIESVAAAAVRERDREFVAIAAAEALAELGYRVESGFEIGVADGSGGIARLPDSDTHGIRIRDDDGMLSINVVKFGETSSVSDAIIEQKFCDDSARIRRELAAKGVQVDLRPHRGAGIVPLQVLRRSPRPDRSTGSGASHDVGSTRAR